MPVHSKENRKTNRKSRANAGEREVVRIALKDGLGNSRWVTADVLDHSENGIGVLLMTPLPPGSSINLRDKAGSDSAGGQRRATVAWCNETNHGAFRVGLEFADRQNSANRVNATPDADGPDYYETMQLSPNADGETIERVYRLLAQRYHPDNSRTGSAETFIQLQEAYNVLSNPERRAGYDARHRETKRLHWNIFDAGQPLAGREAEQRKREGILGLLYAKTLQDPERAAIGIHMFEDLLGCPREHLQAALWYLRGKGFIQRSDNGRYTITVEGFDEVEEGSAASRTPSGHLLGDGSSQEPRG